MPISLPSARALACSGAQLRVVHRVERLVERRGVVAAVVSRGRWRGVGELVVADEVLQADLDRVHVQFGGQHIHHALDAVRGFGPAGAAIGVGGHAVGEDADDVGRRCS